MSRYRKLDPRFWNDEKARQLSDDGKLGFLFVLSHPHMTSLGAMRASLSGLAAELGWAARRFEQALRPAIKMGMVEVNAEASYLGLPNFLKYNEPEGPNSVAGAWLAALDLIPECPEKFRLIGRCRDYLEGRSEKFRGRDPAGRLDGLRAGQSIPHGYRGPIRHGYPPPMSDPGAGAGAGEVNYTVGLRPTARLLPRPPWQEHSRPGGGRRGRRRGWRPRGARGGPERLPHPGPRGARVSEPPGWASVPPGARTLTSSWRA